MEPKFPSNFLQICTESAAPRRLYQPRRRLSVPDLEIEAIAEIYCKMRWLGLDISTVMLDTSDNEISFFLVEEVP
jgi:hypothetical protein